jgi:hypothetical protein
MYDAISKRARENKMLSCPGAPERRRWRSRQRHGGRKVDLAVQGVNCRGLLSYARTKSGSRGQKYSSDTRIKGVIKNVYEGILCAMSWGGLSTG